MFPENNKGSCGDRIDPTSGSEESNLSGEEDGGSSAGHSPAMHHGGTQSQSDHTSRFGNPTDASAISRLSPGGHTFQPSSYGQGETITMEYVFRTKSSYVVTSKLFSGGCQSLDNLHSFASLTTPGSNFHRPQISAPYAHSNQV